MYFVMHFAITKSVFQNFTLIDDDNKDDTEVNVCFRWSDDLCLLLDILIQINTETFVW